MSEKIYAVSCSIDLAAIGLDRIRTRVDGFERTKLSLDWSKVELAPVVADEKIQFEEGDVKIVQIRPIDVPGNSFVFLSLYGVNGMGHLSCIGCTKMKRFSEDRTANLAMFQSRIRSPVSKGDLLGQIIIVPGSNYD